MRLSPENTGPSLSGAQTEKLRSKGSLNKAEEEDERFTHANSGDFLKIFNTMPKRIKGKNDNYRGMHPLLPVGFPKAWLTFKSPVS